MANGANVGRTPLHYAAMHGRVAAIAELVRQGSSLEARDIRGGYTALHLAADAGQCDAVARLVELGARLEAASTKGWTPLGLATFKVRPLPLRDPFSRWGFWHHLCSKCSHRNFSRDPDRIEFTLGGSVIFQGSQHILVANLSP